MKNTLIYDFIGIGIGPFNLGLACLAEPIQELNGVFFDKRPSFNWHPGMLLQDTTLQIPFLADLVTFADPTSPYSFLNYLKEEGRLYSFYIRENFLLLRNEYNKYCQWAIGKLNNVHFNSEVLNITYDGAARHYQVFVSNSQTNDLQVYKTKRLVLGTGTIPFIPKCAQAVKQDIVHSANYLHNKASLQNSSSITILGSGQSAAEIFYDLLQEIDSYKYQLNWITRSPRYFPLEYSKLTLEMTSPEYIDYFYSLPQTKRDTLIKNQKHLYKGINISLISSIYDLLYTKSTMNDIKVHLCTNSELMEINRSSSGQQFEMEFFQGEIEKTYSFSSEKVLFATGYEPHTPGFIKNITERIQWDEKGRYAVNRNYSIDKTGNEIFVQNAELHTHGFATPDLGMACYRNSYLIKEMTEKEHYKIERRIAFQQFHMEQLQKATFEDSTLI